MAYPKRYLKGLTVFLGVILAFIVLGYAVSHIIQYEDIRGVLESLRSYGPFIAIPVIVLEVIIAPIPGGLLPVALGALYGPVLGVVYAWIGNVIGSMIAFWIAKRFGKQVLLKLMPKMNIDAFEQFVQNRSVTIWIMYMLPVFPIDIMSFSLGLSRMTYKRFFTLVTIAYIPHLLILSFLGDVFTKATTPNKIIIGVAVVCILTAGYVIERRINKRAR